RMVLAVFSTVTARAFSGKVGTGLPQEMRPLSHLQGAGVKALLDNVLQEVAADLVQHGFDDQFLHRSVARMKTLAVWTEGDRCQSLSGYLRLIDYLIDHAPAEMVETIEAQHHAIHAHFNRMYGRPDTPYLTTNRIVSELLEGLKSGRTPEEM